MSDPLDLPAIRKALASGSPGPWVAEGRYVTDATDCVYVCEVGNIGNPCVRRDRDLIVLLRNNAEALLAEIERLRKERDASIAVCEGLSRTQGAIMPSHVDREIVRLRKVEAAARTLMSTLDASDIAPGSHVVGCPVECGVGPCNCSWRDEIAALDAALGGA